MARRSAGRIDQRVTTTVATVIADGRCLDQRAGLVEFGTVRQLGRVAVLVNAGVGTAVPASKAVLIGLTCLLAQQ